MYDFTWKMRFNDILTMVPYTKQDKEGVYGINVLSQCETTDKQKVLRSSLRLLRRTPLADTLILSDTWDMDIVDTDDTIRLSQVHTFQGKSLIVLLLLMSSYPFFSKTENSLLKIAGMENREEQEEQNVAYRLQYADFFSGGRNGNIEKKLTNNLCGSTISVPVKLTNVPNYKAEIQLYNPNLEFVIQQLVYLGNIENLSRLLLHKENILIDFWLEEGPSLYDSATFYSMAEQKVIHKGVTRCFKKMCLTDAECNRMVKIAKEASQKCHPKIGELIGLLAQITRMEHIPMALEKQNSEKLEQLLERIQQKRKSRELWGNMDHLLYDFELDIHEELERLQNKMQKSINRIG